MATYCTKEDLRLVVRDGSPLPNYPELHEEAYRAINLFFTKQGMLEADITRLLTSDDAKAHLRYAEACKVMSLHYQGMGDPTMLERAAYWNQQFMLTMAEVPLAAQEDQLPTLEWGGGSLNFS